MKTFKGRPVVPGTAEATALVSHGGFNTLASFLPVQIGIFNRNCMSRHETGAPLQMRPL